MGVSLSNSHVGKSILNVCIQQMSQIVNISLINHLYIQQCLGSWILVFHIWSVHLAVSQLVDISDRVMGFGY